MAADALSGRDRFELTFQRLDQLCRRDAGCRLQQSGVVVALDEVLARLAAAPVTAPSGARLTVGRPQSVMASLIGSERNWPLMVEALADAQAGNYGLLFQLLPVGGGSNFALFPIRCNDYGTRRPAADYLRADEAIGALHPRFFGAFSWPSRSRSARAGLPPIRRRFGMSAVRWPRPS